MIFILYNRMISEDCWPHFIIDILIFEVTAFWLNEQSESSLKDITNSESIPFMHFFFNTESNGT